MTANPLYVKRLEAEINLLKKELDAAHIKISSITNTHNILDIPIYWGLTPTEHQVFELLYIKERVSKSAFLEHIYFNKTVDIKIIDVFIHKIRHKLKESSVPVEVITIWGSGYALTKESKVYLKQFEVVNARLNKNPEEFIRQPWHNNTDNRYASHKEALDTLIKANSVTVLSYEEFALGYARLRGFISDNSHTICGPLGD